MNEFYEPIAKLDNLNDNDKLDACLTRSYAAVRFHLQTHYRLLELPQEAKWGGQRVKAVRPFARAITVLEGQTQDESLLIAVLTLWLELLERMVQYARDLRERSAAALYSYELAAGTAERLDAAVTRWQKGQRR